MLYDPHIEPIDEFRGIWRCLSNFYAARILYEGEYYPTVEHAYQAAKSFDAGVRRHIAALPKPGDAKRAGQRVKLRSDWEQVKLGIMEDLLQKKFEIWDLRASLVGSWPRQLIEGNDWGDRYWGECDGVGENHLGKLLMKVRLGIKETHLKAAEMGQGW